MSTAEQKRAYAEKRKAERAQKAAEVLAEDVPPATKPKSTEAMRARWREDARKHRAKRLARGTQLAAQAAAALPPPTIDDTTYSNRLDIALHRKGMSRLALGKAIGVSGSVVQHVGKPWAKSTKPAQLNAANTLKAAHVLGVDAAWLLHGPTKSQPVAHANGTPHAPQGAIDQAMHRDADAAMGSLWGLLAPDVKLFLVARAAELLAQHIRRRG